MTEVDQRSGAKPFSGDDRGRLALASRGDALTPYLFAALRKRFDVAGEIDPELTRAQRLLVAAATVRPDRSRWVERFYKSGYARSLRSQNADRALQALPERPDLVFQVHSLFRVTGTPTVLYIDCTHRQSAAQWPAWNPLSGRALDEWYRAETEAYAAADHLFAFCEPTRDSLVHEYGIPAERVTVAGAGANLATLPEPVSVRATDAPPTILFIGNDFVRKGGLVLLDAFRRVREAVPEARLQLVGTTPPVRPAPGVEILGRIRDRARIAELYRQASVFVVPSIFDPFPLVLIEAMAHGLPVVATAQTGVPEMLTDGVTGRMVRPGRVDELAEALLELVRDRETAARYGAAARADVEARFTWETVVDRMIPALQHIGVSPSAR